MVYSSIYRDTYYTTSANTLYYKVMDDTDVIYSGKAVKMPGEDDLKVNINKICRNYLSSDIAELLETSASSIVNINACKEFTLVDGEDNELESYTFLLDYDYSHVWNGGNETLSMPVDGRYVDGMLKPKTTVENGVVTTTRSGNYGYEVSCRDYVIYYLNTRGGWDAFVFNAGQKKDTITQYKTDRAFDNTTLEFESNRYISEIKVSYTLTTDYLDDEQSANFAENLIGTNKAYLQNISEGWIKPVVISDTQVTYQTYMGNSKKLSQYKINCDLSQTKIRR